MATANEMMEAYSFDAVDYAKKLNISLDFSEESIKSVEHVCSILYKGIPKSFLSKLIRKPPSEEMILHVSKMLGGYIGEVMIKHYGGSWAIESFMNENTILINIDDMKAFPVGKVYKRLKNGARGQRLSLLLYDHKRSAKNQLNILCHEMCYCLDHRCTCINVQLCAKCQ